MESESMCSEFNTEVLLSNLSSSDNLNNIYNFKNSIRFFVNINRLDYSTIDRDIKSLSWTQPIIVKLQKQAEDNTTVRIIKMPNLVNFYASYIELKRMKNFYSIEKICDESRMTAELKSGDFRKNSYFERMHNDFTKLCLYDCLLKLDIKSFYDYIYTHDFDFEEFSDRYLSSMNNGRTNGIIMGTYLSLFVAENYLKKISELLKKRLNDKNILCNFSFFSDDFYIFCNRQDIIIVKQVFSSVLLEFELYRNESKDEEYDYFKYSNYNKIDKYWKKIEYENTAKNESSSKNNEKRHYYLNQLISYKEKIGNDRVFNTFIMGFFKSTYFYNLPSYPVYKLGENNIHQILAIYKNNFEAIIFSINKYKEDPLFISYSKIFFRHQFVYSLGKPFWEKQLYLFYALKVLGDVEMLEKDGVKTLVKESNNQVLLSYYVMENHLNNEEIKKCLIENQGNWFLNYNAICKLRLENGNVEELIEKYLIPENCKKERQRNNYLDFYLKNISKGKYLLYPIENIAEEINQYIKREK